MGPYKSQLIVWGSKTNLDPFIQNELSSLVITQALFTAMKHSRPPCSWCFFPVFLLRSTLQWYSQVILVLIHSRASLEILCSDKKKKPQPQQQKKILAKSKFRLIHSDEIIVTTAFTVPYYTNLIYISVCIVSADNWHNFM